MKTKVYMSILILALSIQGSYSYDCLNKIDGALDQAIGVTSKTAQTSTIKIPKTRGVMSLSDNYYAHDKRTRITAAERAALKINQIRSDDFNVKWPNSELSKGKLIYEGEYGKLQTVLHIVLDHGSEEYLLSYNKDGALIDCIMLGIIRSYAGDRGEGTIEGDKATAHFSAEGESYYISYKITPQMKFVKTKEWSAVD